MKLEIKALQPEERLYVYSQSQQLRAQTGSIGHLRGDFGKSGCEFFCTWEGHIKSYRLDTFGDEFDRFINALRFDTVNDRPFAGRNALRLYCKAHPESGFKGNYSEEYGFRVDKGQYSFLLRCNPMVGDYNFYVFCYIKKLLDSYMERARKGIRFVTAFGKEIFRLPDGEKIQITRPSGEKVLNMVMDAEIITLCRKIRTLEQENQSLTEEVQKLRKALDRKNMNLLRSL